MWLDSISTISWLALVDSKDPGSCADADRSRALEEELATESTSLVDEARNADSSPLGGTGSRLRDRVPADSAFRFGGRRERPGRPLRVAPRLAPACSPEADAGAWVEDEEVVRCVQKQ